MKQLTKFLVGGILVGIGRKNKRAWQHDQAHININHDSIHLTDTPPVSILVAAWQEADHIACLISSFEKLRYPDKQLVLCAGGSDHTFSKAQQYQKNNIIVIEQHAGEGKQVALRRAFPYTKGKIIFLTDADCLLDDASFEATIAPLINEKIHVATGRSKPINVDNPFAFLQASTQLYETIYASTETNGILGRNCAVSREMLIFSGGLHADAPTGTDYVLAKILQRYNVLIRFVPQSLIATQYPTTSRAYVRQQRRWLRNSILHGVRFSAWQDVKTASITVGIGCMMLGLPLIGLLFPPLLILWFILLCHVIGARVRYIKVAAQLLNQPLTHQHYVGILPHLFIDFAAWATTLFDLISAKRRTDW